MNAQMTKEQQKLTQRSAHQAIEWAKKLQN
jgi:hypothetical protein